MHDTSRRTAERILLVLLLLFLLVKGILPALTTVQSDFPNYYTAGLIARTGNVDRLYDDASFQLEIDRTGVSQQGKFSPFPPPTALLFMPFSLLDPLSALRLMTMLNVVCLVSAVVVIRRMFFTSLSEAAAFVLLTGIGLTNAFRLGQLYIVLSLTLLLGYYYQKTGSNGLAGLAAGALMPVKYFSIVLLIDALLKKNRTMIAWGLATVAFIGALSIGVLGWDIHWQFLTVVFGAHLGGHLTLQDPFSPLFQSFDSLLRRLFLFDDNLNAHPVFASPVLYFGLKVFCLLAVAVTAVYAMRAAHRHPSDLALAVLCVAALLLAPATATYHFLLLWLPVGILLRHFREQNSTKQFFSSLACYAAIGFIPYSMFVPFDGRGILTLLAYPRLILLIVLFVITVSAAVRLPGAGAGTSVA
jgi:Glycosyltransferase family 87